MTRLHWRAFSRRFPRQLRAVAIMRARARNKAPNIERFEGDFADALIYYWILLFASSNMKLPRHNIILHKYPAAAPEYATSRGGYHMIINGPHKNAMPWFSLSVYRERYSVTRVLYFLSWYYWFSLLKDIYASVSCSIVWIFVLCRAQGDAWW